MKIIHCNLWGDIEISDLALSIIDTPHFQRLHYIRQTGIAFKVFPGAHTSRFEHSIGVYGLIRILLDHLYIKQPEVFEQCDKRRQELICIAGMIHDLGHGPFSHLFDRFISNIVVCQSNSWKDHEKRGIFLFDHLIKKFNISMTTDEIDFVKNLILGPTNNDLPWYYYLVNNKISGLDMDKMDYVLRDSIYFGMKIHFNPLRIIKNCRIINDELCFCDRIKDEIITVFLIRNKMNKFIYRHSKICQFENDLLSLLQEQPLFNNLSDTIISQNVDEFIIYNDDKILSMISPNKRWNWECRNLSSEKKKQYLYRYRMVQNSKSTFL